MYVSLSVAYLPEAGILQQAIPIILLPGDGRAKVAGGAPQGNAVAPSVAGCFACDERASQCRQNRNVKGILPT